MCYRWWTGAHKEMSLLPSQIFHRNFYATFWWIARASSCAT